MGRVSFFLAVGAALALVPGVAAAQLGLKRTPWNGDEVAALGSRLIEQAKRLEGDLQASSKAAEAKTENPDREAGVGPRMVVIADLGILESRAKAYVGAVESGLGREDTRSLFGRIDSLVRLTAADVRSLPDFASYRAGLEAVQETVAALRLFYAEEMEVHTPPDPLRKLEGEAR